MRSIGLGWTFVVLGGMVALALPLLYLSMYIGPRYRAMRHRRREDEMARLRENSNRSES